MAHGYCGFYTQGHICITIFSFQQGQFRNFANKEEFKKLYASASTELKSILITAYTTGMRLGEILNLKWEDVDLKEEYILVRDSKNYESRTISIHPTLKETLSHLKTISESDFTFEGRKTIKRAWQKALRLSGIAHCRFHDLRHTFASNLVMNGVDIVTVAELMGHKDLSMTKRYSHPSPQHKKQAINKLKLETMDTYLDTKKETVGTIDGLKNA
ncbi:MAG: site-specific integrase [Candidatus Dadabacteria bacterium]|nr:site-specific integrase [Candidatus Dadabacteria bacterium]